MKIIRNIIKLIPIFFLLFLPSCQSFTERRNSQNNTLFDSALQLTYDSSLIIKKAEIFDDFNNEFNHGSSSSKLNKLDLVLSSENYSTIEKNELLLDSLNRGIIYNILAFKFDKREELIDFYAKRELKFQLHKSMYGYFFYKDLLDYCKRKNLLDEQSEKILQAQMDKCELAYVSLTNQGLGNVAISMDVPADFFNLENDVLLTILNNNKAFYSEYNSAYLEIARKVMEQLPPYNSDFESAIKFNELLFKAPKSLYKDYSDELFIQSDCSMIFGIIGISYQLDLVMDNLKKLETEYAIKSNEYILAEREHSADLTKKFLAMKQLELDRFNYFLRIYYLRGKDLKQNFNGISHKIPSNIQFVLTNTILDIIGENF